MRDAQASFDPGETRTVLLIGEFGDATDDPPVHVQVVDDLMSDGANGEAANFRGAQTDVIALDAGPTLVWAEVVSREIWSQSGRGTSCPSDTQQVVRVTWTGGVRLPDGEEPGDTERGLYRVTLQHADGSTSNVSPASLAELGDNDNNHFVSGHDASRHRGCLPCRAPCRSQWGSQSKLPRGSVSSDQIRACGTGANALVLLWCDPGDKVKPQRSFVAWFPPYPVG